MKPLYSTVSAWNADESRLILYRVGKGHELYDGRTYQFIRSLDIAPSDLEQVYWHTSDPDLLFYADGRLVRYHVGTAVKETVRTFTFCTDDVSAGGDPMFMSWDSDAIGLECGAQAFIYGFATTRSRAQDHQPGTAPARAQRTARVHRAATWWTRRSTCCAGSTSEPVRARVAGPAATFQDTWNGVVFDTGPLGSGDRIAGDVRPHRRHVQGRHGPEHGISLPTLRTHVSALAYRQPGWVFVSIVGDHRRPGRARQRAGDRGHRDRRVCRAAHHRSWGKNNRALGEPVLGRAARGRQPERHPCRLRQRLGRGPTVDTYVLELPSYKP